MNYPNIATCTLETDADLNPIPGELGMLDGTQGVKISVRNDGARTDADFSLRVKHGTFINGGDYTFMDECTLTTDRHWGGKRTVNTDRLVQRRIPVIARRSTTAGRPPKEAVIPVDGHERIVRMAKTVTDLATY